MIKEFFKKYAVYFQRFTGNYDLVKVQSIEQVTEYRRLKTEMELTHPENPALFGSKIYSQTDEDGIIHEIFNRIPNNKIFLEIGIQTGIECNSLNLLLNGWKGTWIEGSSKYCKKIEDVLGGRSFKGKLNVVNSFVDRDNVVELFRDSFKFFETEEIDFFSLDIDGNDYYIAEELFNKKIYPKMLCVEYNAKFPPPVSLTIKYDKTHVWDYSDYMGCSLQAYADLFEQHGYSLVCCNIPGINAFFVRQEFAHLFKKYNIKELYQPYRYYLSPFTLPQTATLRFLKNLLESFQKGSRTAE